jgi:DNA-binding response OmpR family regulator
MYKGLIIIVSEDNYLFQAIQENLHIDIELLKHKSDIDNFLTNPRRIDVLIIDILAYNINQISNYARNIYVFSDLKIKHQIILKKPINLANFLGEILSNINNKKLFSILDKHIYSEARSDFTCSDGKILKLSSIENLVMKNLLISEDFCLSKEFLRENVWKYSKKAETTTMQQTILKLKKALPNGLLKPCKDGYKIFAKEIC